VVGGGVDGDGVYGVEGDEGEVADGVSAYGSSDWMDWMVGVFITAAAFVMRWFCSQFPVAMVVGLDGYDTY